MSPEKIYCHGEAAEFPVEQFRTNEDGSLHMPYIHDVHPSHWASTGEPIDDDGPPGVVGLVGEPEEPPAADPDEAWGGA